MWKFKIIYNIDIYFLICFLRCLIDNILIIGINYYYRVIKEIIMKYIDFNLLKIWFYIKAFIYNIEIKIKKIIK